MICRLPLVLSPLTVYHVCHPLPRLFPLLQLITLLVTSVADVADACMALQYQQIHSAF